MGTRAGLVFAAVAAAALSGCVLLPLPESWQLGGGVSHTRLQADYSALGTQGTDGVDLVASWGLARTWWLDAYTTLGTHRLETGRTQNIDYPPDAAQYAMFAFSVRKDWPAPGRGLTPWASAGLGLGDVSWETYWYHVSAAGPVLGAGLDAPLGESPLALRAQAQWYRFSGEDTYGYGPYHLTGTAASLLLVWTFGGEDDARH